jgi:DNA ligase D-like protein (predicted polymerase)
MQIRKNTKAFKTILEIVTKLQDRGDREKFIRLYITKAGHSINDRINVEAIEGGAGPFYDMNYQTVLGNLKSSNHQLHHSEDTPGIYFFHTSSNKVWDENPFEFDEAIKKEFAPLAELPIMRKKEKADKYVFPAPATILSRPAKNEKGKSVKVQQTVHKGPKQPDYKLKHNIEFSNLERVIFRQPLVTKKDILDYYNQIADYILPYLKDRPQLIRLQEAGGRTASYASLKSLAQGHKEALPDWIQTTHALKDESESLLLCNDKDHLLLYAEIGYVEFNPRHSRTKLLEYPDYIIITIDSPEAGFSKAVDVALITRDILTGLKLPSFVKTDGISGLHIYIPLDAKSDFETCKHVGEYICKLINLKIPALVALEGSEGNTFGKVALNYSVNEDGKTVIAPYSLVNGQSPNVATPLLWDELSQDIQPDQFNYQTIFKRLKQNGDPFAVLFKKKMNAQALFEMLDSNYSFLF